MGKRLRRRGFHTIRSWLWTKLCQQHGGEIRMWRGLRTSPSFEAGVPGGTEIDLCGTWLTGEESGLDRKTINSVFETHCILVQLIFRKARRGRTKWEGQEKRTAAGNVGRARESCTADDTWKSSLKLSCNLPVLLTSPLPLPQTHHHPEACDLSSLPAPR